MGQARGRLCCTPARASFWRAALLSALVLLLLLLPEGPILRSSVTIRLAQGSLIQSPLRLALAHIFSATLHSYVP